MASSVAATSEYSLSSNVATSSPKLRRVGKLGEIDSAKTWRRSSDKPIYRQEPKRAKISELSAGQIVYLPRHDQIDKNSIVHKDETHKETFDHPALVVDVFSDEIVEIRTITTLGETPLAEKGIYWNKPEVQKAHLLIQHPRNNKHRWDNPNGSRALHIKDGKKLASPSYVRLDKKMLIEKEQLREYSSDPAGLFLDEESTQYVRQQEVVQLYDRPSSWGSIKQNMVGKGDLAQLQKRFSKSLELKVDDNSPPALSPASSGETLASTKPEPATPLPTPKRETGVFLGPMVSFAARIKAQKEAKNAEAESGGPYLKKANSFP